MTEEKDFLGQEPVGKLLLKLALPTVTAQIINMLYNIVDRIYIGHIPDIGDHGSDGRGRLHALDYDCYGLRRIRGIWRRAREPPIYMGQGDHESAEKTLGNCFVVQCVISVVLTAVLLIWNRDFLLAFGASENTIAYGVQYMNVYALGTIYVQMTLGMNAFITAQGFAKTGMLSVLIGAVANIVLDPIFIFGFSHGRGWRCLGHIISQAMSCAWVAAVPVREKDPSAAAGEKFRPGPQDRPARFGPGPVQLYHAGQRKRYLCLLQLLSAALLRRHRCGRHDHSHQRDAVCHAALCRAWDRALNLLSVTITERGIPAGSRMPSSCC